MGISLAPKLSRLVFAYFPQHPSLPREQRSLYIGLLGSSPMNSAVFSSSFYRPLIYDETVSTFSFNLHPGFVGFVFGFVLWFPSHTDLGREAVRTQGFLAPLACPLRSPWPKRAHLKAVREKSTERPFLTCHKNQDEKCESIEA